MIDRWEFSQKGAGTTETRVTSAPECSSCLTRRLVPSCRANVFSDRPPSGDLGPQGRAYLESPLVAGKGSTLSVSVAVGLVQAATARTHTSASSLIPLAAGADFSRADHQSAKDESLMRCQTDVSGARMTACAREEAVRQSACPISKPPIGRVQRAKGKCVPRRRRSWK